MDSGILTTVVILVIVWGSADGSHRKWKYPWIEWVSTLIGTVVGLGHGAYVVWRWFRLLR